jgi:hypothetical protein
MIELLERAPEMSVAGHSFEAKREVNTMTATSTTAYGITARRSRPHGLDRAVMRVSLMMLLAARRHADRSAVGYDEHTRLHALRVANERREHTAATLIARSY